MFSPSRLTIARHRRAWTKSELAKHAGVTLRSISSYEAGDTEPSDDTLATIARVLQFPLTFFTAPELDEPSANDASFRAMSTMSAVQRDAALAAGALAIEFSRWLDRRFVLPEPNLPDLRDTDPEAAAVAIRRSWGIGEKPIPNLVHLLELSGVRVFSLAEHCREVDAFSLWRHETPYVFLNTQKTPEHSRFDAAHELGHLVLHRHGHGDCEGSERDAGDSKGRKAEEEANAFAAALLMPRTSLLAMTPRVPTFTKLVDIKKTWRVSLAALIHRLHRLRSLSDWQYRSLCIEISRNGYRTKEIDGYPHREGSQVLAKAFAELRENRTGHADIARSLHLPTSELEGFLLGLTMTLVDGEGSAPSDTPRSAASHLRLVE